MSDNFSTNENINSLFEKLESFLQSKTVVGEPLNVGETTIIPFIDISFGLGTGGGSGTDEKGIGGTLSFSLKLLLNHGDVVVIKV